MDCRCNENRQGAGGVVVVGLWGVRGDVGMGCVVFVSSGGLVRVAMGIGGGGAAVVAVVVRCGGWVASAVVGVEVGGVEVGTSGRWWSFAVVSCRLGGVVWLCDPTASSRGVHGVV